jgi:sulfur-carrier protein
MSSTTSTPISAPMIQVTLKLFSIYQEVYGRSEQVYECPMGTTVGDLRDRLITEHPKLATWREVTRFGVNLEFVPETTILQEGDEVVLIPPVSGG